MKKTVIVLWINLLTTVTRFIDHVCDELYLWHQNYLEWLEKTTIIDRIYDFFDGKYDESYDNDIIQKLYDEKKQTDNRIFCMRYGWFGVGGTACLEN